MARPRGAKLTQDRLSDGSIVFSAEVTVAVGDRRHVTLGYSREGMDRTAALKQLEKVQATVALGQWVDPRPAEPTGAEITGATTIRPMNAPALPQSVSVREVGRQPVGPVGQSRRRGEHYWPTIGNELVGTCAGCSSLVDEVRKRKSQQLAPATKVVDRCRRAPHISARA